MCLQVNGECPDVQDHFLGGLLAVQSLTSTQGVILRVWGGDTRREPQHHKEQLQKHKHHSCHLKTADNQYNRQD